MCGGGDAHALPSSATLCPATLCCSLPTCWWPCGPWCGAGPARGGAAGGIMLAAVRGPVTVARLPGLWRVVGWVGLCGALRCAAPCHSHPLGNKEHTAKKLCRFHGQIPRNNTNLIPRSDARNAAYPNKLSHAPHHGPAQKVAKNENVQKKLWPSGLDTSLLATPYTPAIPCRGLPQTIPNYELAAGVRSLNDSCFQLKHSMSHGFPS